MSNNQFIISIILYMNIFIIIEFLIIDYINSYHLLMFLEMAQTLLIAAIGLSGVIRILHPIKK